jgi:hypothetical protein
MLTGFAGKNIKYVVSKPYVSNDSSFFNGDNFGNSVCNSSKTSNYEPLIKPENISIALLGTIL